MTIPLLWAVGDRCVVAGRLGVIDRLVTIREGARIREQRAHVLLEGGGAVNVDRSELGLVPPAWQTRGVA